MADLLPAEHAGIVPWDADASAANAARLIAEPQPLVDAVRAAGKELMWDRTAEQLLQVYRDAATAPRRVSAEPRESLTDLAMSLVGPGGWLSARRPARAARGLRPPGVAAHRVRRRCGAATGRCTGRGGRRTSTGD